MGSGIFNKPWTFLFQSKHKTSRVKSVVGTFKEISDAIAVATLISNESGDKPPYQRQNRSYPGWTSTTFEVDHEQGGGPATLLVKIFDEVLKGEDIPSGSVIFKVREPLLAAGGQNGQAMMKEVLFAKIHWNFTFDFKYKMLVKSGSQSHASCANLSLPENFK